MISVVKKFNPRKYGKLLSAALPTIIKTVKENDRAILLVDGLLAKGGKLTSEEKALLELLGKLIADFEERFYQPKAASPQEILRELMLARGLQQKDLMQVFGSKSRISEVVNGKREISKAQAKAIANFFGVSVELFI